MTVETLISTKHGIDSEPVNCDRETGEIEQSSGLFGVVQVEQPLVLPVAKTLIAAGLSAQLIDQPR